MKEVWFHAYEPVGKHCKVYDANGNKIDDVRSYEVFSRTIVTLCRNEEGNVLLKKGIFCVNVQQIPDSYIVVRGVKY